MTLGKTASELKGHKTMAIRSLFLALGLGLAVAACAQPGEPVTHGPAAAHPQVEMRFTPTALADRLAFDTVTMTRRGELALATVVLRNPESRAMSLQYQTYWTDAQGVPIGNATVWRRLALTSGETDVIQMAAPSPDGERLVLQIQPLD